MEITNLENDEAVLYGTIVDQAALHGLLTRVRDLGLPLVAVRSVGATGEDLGDDLTQPALRLTSVYTQWIRNGGARQAIFGA